MHYITILCLYMLVVVIELVCVLRFQYQLWPHFTFVCFCVQMKRDLSSTNKSSTIYQVWWHWPRAEHICSFYDTVQTRENSPRSNMSRVVPRLPACVRNNRLRKRQDRQTLHNTSTQSSARLIDWTGYSIVSVWSTRSLTTWAKLSPHHQGM